MNKFKPSIVISAFLVITIGFVLFVSPSSFAHMADMIPSGTTSHFSNEISTAPVSDSFTDAFHFLEPLAPKAGDPRLFDSSVLSYLRVEICEVNATNCIAVKAFMSTGPGSDQIRITTTNSYGSFYVVNWDTSKSIFSNTKTYRVSVLAAGLLLGSTDLTPDRYASFGRTWPIKFLIEKDPALRIQILSAAGTSLWEIADNLREDFKVCGDELYQLLLNNFPNATSDEVRIVVDGVCQEIVLPPTTKIADAATRTALAFYDPATGRMFFAIETPLLKNLKINDVMVSKPSAAAPFGYLRKVTSIRKNKGTYTIETVQAKFIEAISKGTLQVAGNLVPSGSSSAARSKTLNSANFNAIASSFDEGDQLTVDQPIDVTVNLEGGDDEIGGTGTVRVVGHVKVKAGYNIGAGIETCVDPPFVCVDRLEAWMGFEQMSNLRVIGNFEGHVHKEETIYPVPMEPIIFFIGFFPVVLVPQVDVIVGVDGTAHINFEFAAESNVTMKPYYKWTEDDGWKDLSKIDNPFSNTFLDADIDGTIQMEAYAKLDAALLLYGAIGPSMDGSLGIGGKAQTGGSPLWEIYGHAQVGIGLRSIFTDLFDIGEPRDVLLDETFNIKSAEKLKPSCFKRDEVIPVDIEARVFLGPSGNGLGGYFNCTDPDGDSSQITYSAVSSAGDFITNMWTRFLTADQRTVTVTATDSDGMSEVFSLIFKPQNSLPVITPFAATNTVGVGVQYFINVLVYDWELRGYLPCGNFGSTVGVKFEVVAPNTIAQFGDDFNCSAEAVFTTPGIHKIKITARDRNNGTSDLSVDVNVTAAPTNPAPVIDRSSINFSAVARTSVFKSRDSSLIICNAGTICRLPNGEGIDVPGQTLNEYILPFHLSFSAADPNGQTLTKKWYCRWASTTAEMTQNSDGSYACGNAPPDTPTFVWGTVSDGTTIVATDMRNYVLGSGLR